MFKITPTRTAVVYLAGGMKTSWQDILLETFSEVLFIDPRNHSLKSEADFTRWDLTGVTLSDIVFGYMEKTNPHGGGLATEFGWAAKEPSKHIIYVEEPGFPHSRGLAMARSIAHSVHSSLESGIVALGEYLSLPVERQLLRERIEIHQENMLLVAKRPALVSTLSGAKVGS